MIHLALWIAALLFLLWVASWVLPSVFAGLLWLLVVPPITLIEWLQKMRRRDRLLLFGLTGLVTLVCAWMLSVYALVVVLWLVLLAWIWYLLQKRKRVQELTVVSVPSDALLPKAVWISVIALFVALLGVLVFFALRQ